MRPLVVFFAVSAITAVIASLFISFHYFPKPAHHPPAAVNAIFVFGDSTVDAGNNLRISGAGNADYYPYGIDFPGKNHMGRFSNGKLLSDLLADHYGIKTPKALLTAEFHEVVHPNTSGMNFASATCGILANSNMTNCWTFGDQIEQFRKYLLVRNLYGVAFNQSSSVFLVSMGANDFVKPKMMNQAADEDLPDSVMKGFKAGIMKLYKLGARRFLVVGICKLGCIPVYKFIDSSGATRCDETLNHQISEFSSSLQTMLLKLSGELAHFSFEYLDTSGLFEDVSKTGTMETDLPCCGEKYGGCLPHSKVCTDRTKFAFWDHVHPSEEAYRMAFQNISFSF